MLNKYLSVVLIISVFGFSSCIPKSKKETTDPLLHITIPVKQLQTTKLSEVIFDFKAVKLEFNENSMIQSVRKVICHKALIYVLDTFGEKAVLVYDMKGKFVRRIGEVGRGPGQYSLPQDFLIDEENNEIEILGNRQIAHFSLDGKYLRYSKINFTGINFIKRNDKYFFAISGKEDYKLVQTNLDGEIKKSFLPTYKNYESGVAFSCFIPQQSNQVLYRPLRRDTIYSIRNSKVSPYRVINFGKYRFNLKAYNKLPRIEQMKFMRSKKNINQCVIRNYFENDKYIHLCYNMSGNFYEYILNKKTGKNRHFGNESLTDDVLWQKDSKWMVGGDEQYIYYTIEPYKYKSTKQLQKFFESFTDDESYIQEMLKETSNPILLFAKYKV